MNKFVWDLTHDGAETIAGAQVDAGNPAQGIPVSPGLYTVKLTFGKETVETKVEVKADPRHKTPPPVEQEVFALKLRDQITKLSTTVNRLRAMRKQLAFRKELLGKDDTMKDLLKSSDDYGKKLAALEEKLHNPKAKIVYDIFSAKGGAMLYSQFSFVLSNATDGEGAPTKAMLEVEAELSKELDKLVAEFDTLVGADLKALNDAAAKLGVPPIYVPKK